MLNERTYDVWSYEVLSEFTNLQEGELVRVRFQVGVDNINTHKVLVISRDEFKEIVMRGKFRMMGDKLI